MEIAEVIEVLHHIDTSLEATNLHGLFQGLVAALTAASQATVKNRAGLGEANIAVVNARDRLLQVQEELEPPIGWPSSKRRVYEQYGAGDVIGISAANVVRQILAQHAVDPAGAAGAMNRLSGRVPALRSLIAPVLAGLRPLSTSVVAPPQDPDKAVAILTFSGDVAVKTLADLKDQAGRWDYVFQTFAQLTHKPLESPRLLDVRRGSIIIDVAAVVGVISVLALTLHNLLAAREKALSARKLVLEIKKLEMVGDETGKALEDAAGAKIEKEATNTTNKLMSEHGWSDSGDANELRIRLRDCVMQVHEFYADGGRIEFRLVAATATEDQRLLTERFVRTQQELLETIGRVEALTGQINAMKALPPKSE